MVWDFMEVNKSTLKEISLKSSLKEFPKIKLQGRKVHNQKLKLIHTHKEINHHEREPTEIRISNSLPLPATHLVEF